AIRNVENLPLQDPMAVLVPDVAFGRWRVRATSLGALRSDLPTDLARPPASVRPQSALFRTSAPTCADPDRAEPSPVALKSHSAGRHPSLPSAPMAFAPGTTAYSGFQDRRPSRSGLRGGGENEIDTDPAVERREGHRDARMARHRRPPAGGGLRHLFG